MVGGGNVTQRNENDRKNHFRKRGKNTRRRRGVENKRDDDVNDETERPRVWTCYHRHHCPFKSHDV